MQKYLISLMRLMLQSPQKNLLFMRSVDLNLFRRRIQEQNFVGIFQIFVKDMIQICYKQEIITCESYEELGRAQKQGKFCRLRYIGGVNQGKIDRFRSMLIDLFLSKKYLPDNFSFYENLSLEESQILKKYLVDQKQSDLSLRKIGIPKLALPQIYSVRGIIAYGILQHCLSLRCGVDFGIPDKDHPKKVGVPFQAADVPSKRSQFAHPDVATILSYISRYVSGLTRQEFNQCISRLLRLTQSSQKASYKQWLNQLQPQARKKLNKEDITKVNLKSNNEINQLYDCFYMCRPTIAFWLNKIVFPSDLRQYTDSITASSWDIANARESIGFSGTKDSRCIFPAQLNWVPSHDDEIRGTDGKNIALLLCQTKSVVQIPDSIEDPLISWTWQKFMVKALAEDISCIIDAGALLVGKSIKQEIAPWVGQKLIKMKTSLKGITYPNQKGKWEVYDFHSKTYIQRGTRIPEHETFVIFDEARTRGSDIKMSNSVCAALTLSPNMTQLKLMQAMGRLRNIEAGQTIKIFSTAEILEKIKDFSKKQSTQNQVKTIIRWVIWNSVKQNQKFFFHNTRLGWLHFRSMNLGMRPFIQKFNPNLDAMYKNFLTEDTPYNLNQNIIEDLSYNEQKILQNPIANKMFSHILKYGKNFKIKCQGFDDVCQREVQMIEQVEQQHQKQLCENVPVAQNEDITKCSMKNITVFPYEFDDKLKASFNFRNCTNKSSLFVQNNVVEIANKYNQLMYANFVEVSCSGLCLITQKQANKLMKNGIRWINPRTESFQNLGQPQNIGFVARFCDLNIGTKIIKQLKLQQPLIQSLFFNGHQIFTKQKLEGQSQEELSQFQILRAMLKKNRGLKQIDWEQRLEQLPGHFLERRRIFHDKYQESSLQKLFINLRNDKI